MSLNDTLIGGINSTQFTKIFGMATDDQRQCAAAPMLLTTNSRHSRLQKHSQYPCTKSNVMQIGILHISQQCYSIGFPHYDPIDYR